MLIKCFNSILFLFTGVKVFQEQCIKGKVCHTPYILAAEKYRSPLATNHLLSRRGEEADLA